MVKSQYQRRIISLILYIVIAVFIAYLLVSERTLTLKVGEQAPLDEKIALLNGPTSTFRRLARGPILVNFWATWCPPCRTELPILANVQKLFQGQIIFIGAAIASPKEDIVALKNSFNLNYALGQIDEDVKKKWQAEALPTTYLIDTKGHIVWAHTGAVHEDELKAQIKALLERR
ncbi:MAG TPA: TlpA disulfide reductase family protein [Myxococcota bacterium]|nr:TlpA disulfide reductase family protein [Myxococcota bacterium]